MSKTERGNILFLILLAVVLFAALNFAVTSSMRGGEKDSSLENYEIAASAYLQYFSLIDTAVLRMTLNQNITPENISFVHDSYHFGNSVSLSAWMHNPSCVTVNCRVFDPGGGNVKGPLDVYKQHMGTPKHTWTIATPLYLIQWPGAGTSLNDIALVFPLMRVGVCKAVNKALGISGIPTFSSTGTSYDHAKNPTFWDSSPAITITANSQTLYGQSTFASGYTASGNNTETGCSIFHLLLTR